MSYTVFARKYRPQTFDDVVGQEHITRTLKNAILQNRLAHAYLFVGPRGTGKTSSARILAKALNCLASAAPTVTPCGECDSCREITGGNSLDVLEFDAASNTQVDKVRDIIIDNVKYLPARGRFKVYLVDEVHMLSPGSFNALLKTLEEPPPHVKFLFATTDVQKLPATILSRCQRFDLKRIGAVQIADHLLYIASKEGIHLSGEAALAVAVGADGGMRDAESMLDQLVAFCGEKVEEADVLSVFGFTSRQKISDLCSALLDQDAPGALKLVHEQAEAGRDLSQLLADLISHLRNLLLAQADPSGLEVELGRPVVQALEVQCNGVERERILELIDICAAAEQKMKWASNKQMYLEVALLRAIQAVGQVTLGEILGALTDLREGRPSAGRAASAPRQRVELPKPEHRKLAAVASEAQKGEVSKAKPPKVDAPETVTPDKAVASEPELPVKVEVDLPKVATPEAPLPVETVKPPVAPVVESSHVEIAPKPAAVEPKVREVEELWPELVQAVRNERPLISMWLESGVLAEIKGGFAFVHFPKDQPLAVEYLVQDSNRLFLEGILSVISGVSLKLRTELSDTVVLRPVAKQERVVEKVVVKDPMEEFKNDPLIRKALEIFKGRLESI